jgi:hypothetical protein
VKATHRDAGCTRSCTRCERTAIVGYGPQSEWLCLTHYEEELNKVWNILQAAFHHK